MCTAAIDTVQLVDTRLDQALTAIHEERYGSTPERRAVEQMAEELDVAAWDLQDQSEQGECSKVDYHWAFRKARAASAVAFAFGSDSLEAAFEALYEAHFAIEDKAVFRTAVIDSLLRR